MGGNINLKQTTFAGVAEALRLLHLTGATKTTAQDFINLTVSSGRCCGGEITDDLDGTITVAAGIGFIKSSAVEPDEETYFFDWPESAVVPLVDGEVNYIYVEYNAGTPRAWSTTDRSTINLTDQFTLGRVFKDGATLHIMESGVSLVNHLRGQHERLVAVHWVERASGGVVSEPAALKLKITAGLFYVGSNPVSTAEQDTSGADHFDAWYRDGGGGWTKELAETDVNNEKYDDGDGVLGDIPVGRYSARYVYIDFDGHIHVQYGQQGDKLGIIQGEPVPAPSDFLNEFAILAARVIVKDGISPLVEVASAYDAMFVYQGITNHEDLANVSADQHHAQVHAIVGGDHSAAGLTIGHVIRATGAAAFSWAELQHDDLGGVGVDDHHAQLHAATHGEGQGDALKLDDLAIPDNNTDLDFSTSLHGLVPKGTDVGDFLKDDGTWATVSGVATFLELTDTPGAYAGEAGKFVKVNATPDALIFATIVWGDVSKAGSNLTDLATREHGGLSDAPVDAHHAQLHAATHNNAGADELSHDALKDFVVAEHLTLPNTIANVLSDHTKAVHDALLITVLGSGALAKDHGAAATDMLVNVCYGTGTPPAAGGTTIGTIWLKYT